MEWWSLRKLKGSEPRRRIEYFLSRSSWSDECWFFQQFLRVSYTCVGDSSVYGGECTYTHLLHAHFSAHSASLRISHIFIRFTHSHGSSVMKKRCLSHECLRSLSRFLQPHVSPVTAVPVHPLRHHLSVHNLAVLSRPKSAGHAQRRTCIAKFGYLAKSDANTGNEPNEFDKNNSVDDDTVLINDPNHNFSDFSKTTSENTGQFGSARFSWWFCSSNRKHAIGKPLLDREKEKKEKVLWSVLQSRCQRKVNGTVVVWVWRVTENLVLKGLRKFYSDGWDLREHPQRRARQATTSGNFNSEKIISDWAQHGDPKFEAKKFIKKAMQEVAEILKNWNDAAVKRKLLKKQRRLK